jgi:hypothetical protein
MQDAIAAAVEKLKLGTNTRHIFLCVGGDCAPAKQALDSWDYLKRRVKELGLKQSGGILRSKVDCLRICTGGPIALVYPDGSWYRNCTPRIWSASWSSTLSAVARSRTSCCPMPL